MMRRLAWVFGPILVIWAATLSMAEAQVGLPTTTTSGDAETAVTLPSPLTEEAAVALMSRLTDEQVRQVLLDQLNAQAVPADETQDQAALQEFLYNATFGASEAILIAIQRVPRLVSGQAEAFSNFAERAGGTGPLLQLLGMVALILLVAYAVERLLGYATRSWAQLPPREQITTLRGTILVLLKRLMQEALGLVIFLVVGRILARILIHSDTLQIVGDAVFWLIVLPRVAGAIARFLLAPRNPAYRLVHTDDATALGLERHQVSLVVLLGLSVLLPTFNAQNGVPVGELRLGFWLNLAVHLYVIYLLIIYRSGLQMMMRGSDPQVSPFEERVARAYPAFGIAMSALMWWIVNTIASYGTPEAFRMLGSAPHYKTLGIALFAPALDTAIRGLVKHIVPPMQGEGKVAERAYYATKRSYIRIGRVIVFGLVLLWIMNIWGISLTSLASAGVGVRFAANFVEFLMILSIGYVIYEVTSLLINRKLAAEQTTAGMDLDSEDAGDEGGVGGSRLSTVLPLILMVSRVAIVILFVLLALSHIGIDTTPLLAGAGILGLAIGFGAQKLVADVVSGIFFLVDDAFRTGEYVDVGGTMGTVEKISIRSMQLRHHRGAVHTLPYGEIPKITNFSRDWVIMKLKFTVPFDTDPNKIKKIFKKIGAEMMENELFKDDFLQPFKSQGVFEIDDVGMVMRGKFMAKPGKQFVIRKEIYNRVKAEFTANGIDFARREVRVALPEGDTGTPEEAAAAAAGAVAQVAQEQLDAGKA